MILKRRKRERSGIERVERKSFPGHMQFVRGFVCLAAASGTCIGKIHAHHVRNGTHAGLGLKPHDKWVVPLCARHHDELHTRGADTFEAKYKIDLKKCAEELARRSPHRRKWEIHNEQ